MASSRFRVHVMAQELFKQGQSVIVHIPRIQAWWDVSAARFGELRATIAALRAVSADDVVYLHKTVFQVDFILAVVVFRMVSRAKIIFDFDDAIFLHSRYKTMILLRIAHGVTVASHFNLAFAQRYNHNCIVVPTVLQADVYKRFSADHTTTNVPVIGWIGNARGHYDNLALLEPVLSELACHHDFEFVLIGARGNERVHALFANKQYRVRIVENLNWSDPSDAPRHIQEFDIGVMPLLDTPFNRGKAAFKALEYMACGVPVVLSAVGENKRVVTHKKNGMLASTQDEWMQALTLLLKDATLRKKLGHAGQVFVRDHYSYTAVVPQLLEFIATL